MKVSDKETYIDDEVFMIFHSGEIPEVVLHSSIYYLTEDSDGPVLQLDVEDIIPLKQAVVERYRTIIRRDLESGNRDKRIYRGLARCCVNWQRLLTFCNREGIDSEAYRVETAGALKIFLQRESVDVKSGQRPSSINCSALEIENLAGSLGLAIANLPEGWRDLCPDEEK